MNDTELRTWGRREAAREIRGLVNGNFAALSGRLAQLDGSLAAGLAGAQAALAAARAELEGELEALDGVKCEIVFGTYAGDKDPERVITLGFTPRAVIVVNRLGLTFSPGMNNQRSGGIFFPGISLKVFRIVEGGFSVPYVEDQGLYSLNSSSTTCSPYYYMAFR